MRALAPIFALVGLTGGAGGCAGPSRPDTAAETRAQVERAAEIGRAIFEQDEATARARDALLGSIARPDPRLQGWVTRGTQGSFTTSFLAVDGGAVDVRYEVRLGTDPVASVVVVDPPRPIDTEGAAIFRAQKTASGAVEDRCRGAPYNPVVLPAALVGKDGWLVYLLVSSPTRPRETVLAGHHRVRVSADGSQVLEHTPLSETCLVSPPSDRKGALLLSSPAGDHPNEGHFFTSLHYGVPLYLVFGNGWVWRINRGAWEAAQGR